MRSALVPILLADPLPWAQKAEYAWDFLRDRARFGGRYRGVLANTPGWTFTRASTGYYTTTGGVLVPFASGSLRTGDRGALIEGAGTNLCLQSQTFDNASWTKWNCTISADATVAPDGTTTADKLIESTSTSGHETTQAPSPALADNTTYTFSVFVKAAERTFCTLIFPNKAGSFLRVNFNLVTGAATVIAAPAAYTATQLADGWWRLSITISTSTGATVSKGYVGAAFDATTSSYTGDGTSGIYLWGAQLEAAAYASSYIPTTTASATRAADSLTVTGVSGLDYPLTLYADWERVSDPSATQGVFSVDSGSGDDEALIYISSANNNRIWVENGSTNVADTGFAGVTNGTVYKTAARIALNNVQIARAGALATADTSAGLPTTPARIMMGQRGGSSPFYGYLRRLAIFSRALSDAELQALTT